jgi:hypothetical protein
VRWNWVAWGLVAAAGVLAFAAIGWVLAAQGRSIPRALAMPAFLVASNVAVMHAAARAISRGSERLWEPTRRESMPASRPGV